MDMFSKILKDKIENKKAVVGIIGLGFVGLPHMIEFCSAGIRVIGFEIDEKKVLSLNRGESYIDQIPSEKIASFIRDGLFEATVDMNRLSEPDAILICVPTPLTPQREPDTRFIVKTTEEITKRLRGGQLVVLESTTYPGCTEEDVLPILNKSGLRVGTDYFLAFSPERIDPGNKDFTYRQIPKVVGGITKICTEVASALYSHITKAVSVSNTRTAEMVKLLENIFRSVNIALVNELKIICERMGIDVWEVIESAKTKPYGFMPFYPGPGLGGHCIPIDPFYLTWKARQYDITTRFIELAGEINTRMPEYVIEKTVEGLNRQGKCLNGAKVLVLGIAYKPNIDDMRESPAVRIIELLMDWGADVSYHDPYLPSFSGLRSTDLAMGSVELSQETLRDYDVVIIITNHSCFDYEMIVREANLVVDTRGATRGISDRADKVIRA
ncbi:MAG: nucleotide sugar dehydrogenase [bacterium]